MRLGEPLVSDIILSVTDKHGNKTGKVSWNYVRNSFLQEKEIFAVIPQLKGMVSWLGTCASCNARQISSIVYGSIGSILFGTYIALVWQLDMVVFIIVIVYSFVVCIIMGYVF